MANLPKVVTVVEIPLAVPFSDFLHEFQLHLLPVLLGEEGVISVRTGIKVKTSEKFTHPWAVSLTEWDSLESHAKFVERETSIPFFKKLAGLSQGPPTIDHYSFGSLKALRQSECSRFIFTTGAGGGGVPEAISAESMDNDMFCTLVPVNEETPNQVSGHGRIFDAVWYSFERNFKEANL